MRASNNVENADSVEILQKKRLLDAGISIGKENSWILVDINNRCP
jgi:hypothetical protein